MMGKTPVRGVRIPDEVWKSAQEAAGRQGTTVSAVINRLLRSWTRRAK